MRKKIKRLVNQVLGYFGLQLVQSKAQYRLLLRYEMLHNKDNVNSVFAEINPKLINTFEYPKMHSQIGQEFFVLGVLNLKKDGFFVEFGATNGKSLSNTYILEKEFGWSGICAEPALNWREELKNNRKCHIDFRCVYSSSGKRINFKQTQLPELSTIADFEDTDLHSLNRKKGEYYEVITVTLVELLDTYNAPAEIDYISIDTEGSELEILKEFDFIKYKVRVFTIEHNFTPNREEILKLMESKGYKRVYQEMSDFDDWYLLT